tara:strand:+ start:1254 stop:1544 length:291 start_codon:yes stop_codon:yes gene_type:complete
MATKKELTELIKRLTKQLAGEADPKQGDLLPHYTIKGSGDGYFFSYIDRNFIKIPRNTEVFVLAENFDRSGRSLVYTFSHEIILIEPDELDYIGFN